MKVGKRALLLSLFHTCALSTTLTAQSFTLAGRARHVTARDTVPAAGLMVVAHAVSQTKQGPIDSMRADAAGRFHFRVARPDSSAVYVVSASWDGIGYFSNPIEGQDRTGSDTIALLLFDTASAGEPLSIGTRHVVITRASQDGSRHVLDIVSIVNGGTTTRVGRDSTAPVWRMRLPDGVVGPAVGEGDVPASAVRFENGFVLVSAPIPPGEKQIAVTYDLPAGRKRLEVPVDQPTELVEVLAEDSLTTPVNLLTRTDPMPVEDRVFQRFIATDLKAGARPAVSLTRVVDPLRAYWWIPVGAAALLLLAGAYYAKVARRPA